MSERLSWDRYFMTITRQVAERSTCARAKVGAVIVRDKNILATGYNGASHGCVNVRDRDAVAWLFDEVDLGDKVIVYWS